MFYLLCVPIIVTYFVLFYLLPLNEGVATSHFASVNWQRGKNSVEDWLPLLIVYVICVQTVIVKWLVFLTHRIYNFTTAKFSSCLKIRLLMWVSLNWRSLVIGESTWLATLPYFFLGCVCVRRYISTYVTQLISRWVQCFSSSISLYSSLFDDNLNRQKGTISC